MFHHLSKLRTPNATAFIFLQVMLLQACQGADRRNLTATAPAAPTQLSDPHKDQHITLTRSNTVLLLATVRGGAAYRGVFTGAMADQFRDADGQTDIYAMFTGASSKCSQQNPKFESTAKKRLVLPPANCSAADE